MTAKRIASVLAAAALVAGLAGCSMTTASDIAPGDGPAAASKPAVSKTTAAKQDHSQPAASKTADAPKVATFSDKVVYPDGIQVEVTKIAHHKVTAQQAEFPIGSEKAGDPYVILSVRVKNGSTQTLDAFSNVGVTYGPDGDEAETFYGGDGNDARIDGKILPGKSKTGQWAFLIPTKEQKDVVAEVDFDFAHDSAIFSGSVK